MKPMKRRNIKIKKNLLVLKSLDKKLSNRSNKEAKNRQKKGGRER